MGEFLFSWIGYDSLFRRMSVFLLSQRLVQEIPLKIQTEACVDIKPQLKLVARPSLEFHRSKTAKGLKNVSDFGAAVGKFLWSTLFFFK